MWGTHADNHEVASISIIETINPKMAFTLHLRGAEAKPMYTVLATIYYEEHLSEPDQQVTIPANSTGWRVVDHAETTFSYPNSPSTG